MATRQYEDLVPKSEWKDEPEATLLTIDLPGFAKGQIKVAYVQNSKTIRVTGERSAADQKWIRFNEVFTVPKNCLVDKIHGSFANNVLTITMPKETITKMDDFPEAEEKMEKVKEKRFLEEGKRKKKVEKAKQKKNKLMEERERLTRKMEEEAKAKEKAEMMKKKLQEEEAKAKEKAEMMRKLQEEEAKAKEKAEMTRKLEEQAKGKAKEKAEMIRKLEEEAKAKEKHEEMKLPEVVYEVAKSAEEVLGYLLEKEKMMEKGGIMEKIMGKEITSEEKKKIMNVGVVALISFALGAYVSNTFCSSSSSSSSSTKPE